MKKIIMLIVGVLMVGVLASNKCGAAIEGWRINASVQRVGITQIIEHPALNATRRGLLDELESQGFKKDENIIIYFQSAQGSPVIASQIAQQFAGMHLNVAVGIGTAVAQSLVANMQGTSTPVVFSSITDPKGAGLVQDYQRSEKNVTGVSNFIPIMPQLEFFKQIVPSLKRLGIIYNLGEANSVSLNEQIEAEAPKIGLAIVLAPVTGSIEVSSAAQSLVGKVDAILVTNDNTALSAFDSILRIANDVKLPVFVSDTDLVKNGAIGALGPNQYEIGRQTGRMVAKILKKEPVSQLPMEFPEKVEMYINVKVMQQLGLGEVIHALGLPADEDIVKRNVTTSQRELL